MWALLFVFRNRSGQWQINSRALLIFILHLTKYINDCLRQINDFLTSPKRTLRFKNNREFFELQKGLILFMHGFSAANKNMESWFNSKVFCNSLSWNNHKTQKEYRKWSYVQRLCWSLKQTLTECDPDTRSGSFFFFFLQPSQPVGFCLCVPEACSLFDPGLSESCLSWLC